MAKSQSRCMVLISGRGLDWSHYPWIKPISFNIMKQSKRVSLLATATFYIKLLLPTTNTYTNEAKYNKNNNSNNDWYNINDYIIVIV